MGEYYQNPETVKDEEVVEVVSDEVVNTDDTAGATAEEAAEWVEDDEGNFIKKGE